MNQLDTARRTSIVRCLIEGYSIRSTVRMTGASKNTIVKLLVELGAACSEFMDGAMRNLSCQRIQADEIWSFVYAKQKNVPAKVAERQIAGDIWTWLAIDADTKLVPCWMLGQRDALSAREFIDDLAGRLANSIQLTTDGLKVYVNAVDRAFGEEIDYAQLHKVYGENSEGQKRYSPAGCVGCTKQNLTGDPDPRHVSTSYVERQNLNMRMGMRRFTRLTNAFSKKVENLAASVALYYTYYNFGRVHQTLKTTPAIKAGIADHVWTVEEIVGLLEKSN